jgi:hypothetical protein
MKFLKRKGYFMKIKKGFLKTQTAQPRTSAKLSESEKEDNEKNLELLLSLCDSLDELNDKLIKLSILIDKNIAEQKISQEKGVKK